MQSSTFKRSKFNVHNTTVRGEGKTRMTNPSAKVHLCDRDYDYGFDCERNRTAGCRPVKSSQTGSNPVKPSQSVKPEKEGPMSEKSPVIWALFPEIEFRLGGVTTYYERPALRAVSPYRLMSYALARKG